MMCGLIEPVGMNIALDGAALTIPAGGLWIPDPDPARLVYVKAGTRVALRGTVNGNTLLPLRAGDVR